MTAASPVTGKPPQLQCSIHNYGSELMCATVAPATGIVVMGVADVKTGPSSSGTATSQFSPTPEEVAKAQQALAGCKQDHPGTTLLELSTKPLLRSASSAEIGGRGMFRWTRGRATSSSASRFFERTSVVAHGCWFSIEAQAFDSEFVAELLELMGHDLRQ